MTDTAFERTTAVEPIGEGLFRAELDPRWWVARGPHGGYLAAIILRALTATAPDRPPRSLTIHYAAAPAEGSVEIATSIERVGRSATALTARLTQDGRAMANAVATFSAPWPDALDFSDAPMPEVGSPEDSFKVPTEGDKVPAFLANFDMRWCLGDPPFSGADHAVVGGWFRMAEPEIADAHVVATLMDAWAPAVFPVATSPIIAPTLDLTIHFRAPLPVSGATPEDFYLGRFTSTLARDGFFEEDGQLWTKDGELIAQSRQLALVMKPR